MRSATTNCLSSEGEFVAMVVNCATRDVKAEGLALASITEIKFVRLRKGFRAAETAGQCVEHVKKLSNLTKTVLDIIISLCITFTCNWSHHAKYSACYGSDEDRRRGGLSDPYA